MTTQPSNKLPKPPCVIKTPLLWQRQKIYFCVVVNVFYRFRFEDISFRVATVFLLPSYSAIEVNGTSTYMYCSAYYDL